MSDVGESVPDGTDDPRAAGRAAVRRHAWAEAFDAWTRADAAGALDGPDLEAFAEAAYFVARADLDLEISERAHHWYASAGDRARAGYLAVQIARKRFHGGTPSIAAGWIRRAERILGDDGDTYAHGYLALAASETAAATGDLERAVALAGQAIAIGETTDDADLKAWSRGHLGGLRVATGDTTGGLALLEEATVAAVNGELSAFTSGITACRMIGTCRDLTDYRRAMEWIEATERYCDRQSLEGFPGVCRIHRAEIASVRGAWDRAEGELLRATAELDGYRIGIAQADGYYALGDVRRLKGDLDGAEAALRQAHGLGRSPEPALALVRLARGDVAGAAAAIDAAVVAEGWDRWARARLLSAQVEISLAAGATGRARSAVDDLATIAEGDASPGADADVAVGRGRVFAAEGDPTSAIRELRRGIAGWRDIGSPYEVARARVVLADALSASGDDVGAELERSAALEAFRTLGAVLDIAALEQARRDAVEREAPAASEHRTFLFTDIVGSTPLAEALGDDAWERLLGWHDATLRRLIGIGDGEVVNTTGDGFFAVFATARSGVDVAVRIQGALADHRAATGFAPAVRIGLHSGDASRRGGDYRGLAVHIAARVAALAAGGEILATTTTLAEAGIDAGDAREVEVRGVSSPVQVAAIPVTS